MNTRLRGLKTLPHRRLGRAVAGIQFTLELLENRVLLDATAPLQFHMGKDGGLYGAYSVQVADLNGDGKPDLIYTNHESYGMAICTQLGNGDGSFQPAQWLAKGIDSVALAVGDFNGDGKTDIAAAELSTNSAVVLLGNGDGTFQAQTSFGVGAKPGSIAVADVNGDGNLDILTANTGDSVSVLLGNGDGSFQSQEQLAVPGNPNSVAVGDFNGDGKIDIATTGQGVNILLGNGDGTFAPAVSVGMNNALLQQVAVADVNGDGISDVIACHVNGANGAGFAVLLSNGDGTFAAGNDYSAGDAGPIIAVADINGDGIKDVVVAELEGQLGIALGNGDGTFQTLQSIRPNIGKYPDAIVVSDVNGDGQADIITSSYNGGACVVLAGPPTTDPDPGGGGIIIVSPVFSPIIVVGHDPIPIGPVNFPINEAPGKTPEIAAAVFADTAGTPINVSASPAWYETILGNSRDLLKTDQSIFGD